MVPWACVGGIGGVGLVPTEPPPSHCGMFKGESVRPKEIPTLVVHLGGVQQEHKQGWFFWNLRVLIKTWIFQLPFFLSQCREFVLNLTWFGGCSFLQCTAMLAEYRRAELNNFFFLWLRREEKSCLILWRAFLSLKFQVCYVIIPVCMVIGLSASLNLPFILSNELMAMVKRQLLVSFRSSYESLFIGIQRQPGYRKAK